MPHQEGLPGRPGETGEADPAAAAAAAAALPGAGLQLRGGRPLRQRHGAVLRRLPVQAQSTGIVDKVARFDFEMFRIL